MVEELNRNPDREYPDNLYLCITHSDTEPPSYMKIDWYKRGNTDKQILESLSQNFSGYKTLSFYDEIRKKAVCIWCGPPMVLNFSLYRS